MSLSPARDTEARRSIRAFQSAVADIREADEPRSARMTLHVLAGLVAVAVLILAVARVDRVVTSTRGQLVTTAPSTVFQALDESIIKTIDIEEGQFVAKGQLLATLDPTFATAAVDQLRAQIDAAEAQIARDRAEINDSPLVMPTSDSPGFAVYAKAQSELYQQQMAQYRAQLASFDQKIALAEVTIAKYKADAASFDARERIAKQIEDMRSTLERNGSGSLLNRLLSTDSRLEARRTLELDRNSVDESEHNLASLKADREAFTQQFHANAAQELASAQATLGAARTQTGAAARRRELVQLTAPEDSFILSIARLSVGSVLKQGDPFITMTTAHAPLEAEIDIAARDVGFIRPGDPVTIKFEAFNFAEHGTAHGKVRWISEDAFPPDPATGDAGVHYKARAALTEVKLLRVPETFRLIPGMTLTADIKVGRRSLANYILGDALVGLRDSMREP